MHESELRVAGDEACRAIDRIAGSDTKKRLFELQAIIDYAQEALDEAEYEQEFLDREGD